MKNKKLLLILAIGLSLAPAAFGVELKVSQTDSAGIQCQFADVARQAASDAAAQANAGKVQSGSLNQ